MEHGHAKVGGARVGDRWRRQGAPTIARKMQEGGTASACRAACRAGNLCQPARAGLLEERAPPRTGQACWEARNRVLRRSGAPIPENPARQLARRGNPDRPCLRRPDHHGP